MVKSADIGSKKLISLSPTPWVQWVMETSEVQATEIITTEFQWVNRDTDVLIRAYTPTDGDFLVLNELQLRYTAKMPQRMTAYAALAREKFDLPVYPVLINILEPSGNIEIATSYQSHFRGLQVQQIMRWDMAVLEQSPWYQEILNRGRKQELIKGIALGLELKFGSQGLELMSEIRSLEDVELLNQILETIRTANNLTELRQLYEK